MTRIAVIADIHANLPALEAVCEDLERQDLDEILVAGDLVGRGPQGTEVTRLIMEKGWPCIRGNHEDYVINFSRGTYPEAWAIADEWSAARWMGDEIDHECREFLDALPMSMTSPLCPSMRLVHGTPESYKKGLGDWTPPEKLALAFSQVEEPLLVCAHTHRPFLHRMSDGLIVNVGSVGMPFNGDWRAQYAIFTALPDGDWDVEFRQVPYDREAIYAAYESSGFLVGGGITAALLLTELQVARPYLVPFFKWVEVPPGRPATPETLEAFMSLYDPEDPFALFPIPTRTKPSRWTEPDHE